MAFVADDAGATLAVADPDGKNFKVLSTRQPPAAFRTWTSGALFNRPAWSPDGKLIALVGSKGQDIAIVDVASGVETAFAWPDVPEFGTVLWFDDDRLLVTRTMPATTNPQVWSLNVWAREFTRVTDDAFAYTNVSNAGEKTTFAATQATSPGGIWMSAGTGGGLKPVLPDGEIAPSAVSVDNAGRIVYRIGTVLWMVDTPDGTPRLATGLAEIADTDPRGAFLKDGNLWIPRAGGGALQALTNFTTALCRRSPGRPMASASSSFDRGRRLSSCSSS